MFKRTIDFHLRRWKESSYRKPLILRGARQVGKTYAVRKLGQEFSSFVEVNFEQLKEAGPIFEKNLNPKEMILSLSLLLKVSITPGKTLLFFDEVQEAPRAILALRYFYEEMPDLHIIAAGSLLEFAIDKVGLPVGRVSTLYMYPLSFFEYLVATENPLAAEKILTHSKDTPFEETIHEKILSLLGQYISIGGMPEAIVRWKQTEDPRLSIEVLRQIAETYRQDFEKYAKKTQVKYVEHLFTQAAHLMGKEFSFRKIHGEYRKRDLTPALALLEKANLLHPIYYCSGQGAPIGAEINLDIFKLIYLDIGLCQILLGSDISPWFLRPLETFQNRGSIAEGFIGQELLAYSPPSTKADLYFWKKKGKNSSAEVDYLIERENTIFPIEVKSGHQGKLKSLHLFLENHPRSPLGIRLSSMNYSIQGKIDSRPLYASVSLAHESQKEALKSLL